MNEEKMNPRLRGDDRKEKRVRRDAPYGRKAAWGLGRLKFLVLVFGFACLLGRGRFFVEDHAVTIEFVGGGFAG